MYKYKTSITVDRVHIVLKMNSLRLHKEKEHNEYNYIYEQILK